MLLEPPRHIRQLADAFIAQHIGEGEEEFVAWAKEQPVAERR